MVQEVQQQWNRYQAPHEIESIWLSKRKVSDHSQVREKWSNGCYASTSISLQTWNEVKSSSRTITWDDVVKYKKIGGKIYIPLSWAYLFKFTLSNWYAVNFTEKFRIYNGNNVIYTYNTNLSDKSEHEILLNLGRKNDISVSIYISGGNPWEILTISPKLQITKL